MNSSTRPALHAGQLLQHLDAGGDTITLCGQPVSVLRYAGQVPVDVPLCRECAWVVAELAHLVAAAVAAGGIHGE